MWLNQGHNELEQSKPCRSSIFENVRFGRFLQHSQIARDVYRVAAPPDTQLGTDWMWLLVAVKLGREQVSRVAT